MIIRSRSKPAKASVSFPVNGIPVDKVFSASEFQLEIAKEISRSNRRSVGREFALLQFPGIGSKMPVELLDSLVSRARDRIRISDSIGWLDGKLTVLLPETNRDGAVQVANDLSLRMSQSQTIENEVSVYPWDDELISLADELKYPEYNDYDEHPRNGMQEELSHQELQEASNENLGSGILKEAAKSAIVSSRTEPVFRGRESDTLSAVKRPVPTPRWKRALDIVGAGTGLIVLSPILAFACAAIKLSSKGPMFFVQKREGKDGRVFGILKFRTMVIDAEARQADLRQSSEQDGPAFKLSSDPRVTSIGKYLRKSCIDELPQLYNVLVGDMSLVGPRPLPVGESYACKSWHRARLTVLPGLTCTWQARGGRKVKFDEWMRMDLDYIRKQSFWYDLKLIFETAFIVILHRGSV